MSSCTVPRRIRELKPGGAPGGLACRTTKGKEVSGSNCYVSLDDHLWCGSKRAREEAWESAWRPNMSKDRVTRLRRAASASCKARSRARSDRRSCAPECPAIHRCFGMAESCPTATTGPYANPHGRARQNLRSSSVVCRTGV